MRQTNIFITFIILVSLSSLVLLFHQPTAESNTEKSNPVGKTGSEVKVGPEDWPWWRGPNRDGISVSKKSPPLIWSTTENVLWKTPLPGKGHSSPTIVGNQIFLATADKTKELQSVLCLDRNNGKRVWTTDIHKGKLNTKGNEKSSEASSTVACDGKNLFVSFLNGGAIYTTSLDRKGKQIWQQKIADYVVHQGYGASPVIHGPLVIVSADSRAGGAVKGLNRLDGTVVWEVKRPKKPNYVSPVVHKVAGREQLIIFGCDLVSSFEPLTGKKNWEIEGATTESVTTTVTHDGLIFTSGGYPRNHVEAVKADGSGKVAWKSGVRVYVPSMIVRDGYLYAVTDAGIAHCWKAGDGTSMWKGRLSGTFTASPTIAGDHFFATNENGKTYVLKANPGAFQVIHENDLGGQVYSTPTFCAGRIYVRVGHGAGEKRRETLYCIGTAGR